MNQYLAVNLLEVEASLWAEAFLGKEASCLIRSNWKKTEQNRSWIWLVLNGANIGLATDFVQVATTTSEYYRLLLLFSAALANIIKDGNSQNSYKLATEVVSNEQHLELCFDVYVDSKSGLATKLYLSAESGELALQKPTLQRQKTNFAERHLKFKLKLGATSDIITVPLRGQKIYLDNFKFFLSEETNDLLWAIKIGVAKQLCIERLQYERGNIMNTENNQMLKLTLGMGVLELSLSEFLCLRQGSKLEIPVARPQRVSLNLGGAMQGTGLLTEEEGRLVVTVDEIFC